MVLARNIAALFALGCTGFAIGDWASHPNAVGLLGILLLLAVFGYLLSYLFLPRATPAPARAAAPSRDDDFMAPPPPPPPPPSAPRPVRRKPQLSAPPAGWDSGEDADRLWS